MGPRTRVILLTNEACAFCDDAKQILDRLKDEFGFELSEVPLDSARGLELAGGSVMFPPGILIDGEVFCHGRPSERKLRRRLMMVPTQARPDAEA